jgi:hypothetical protein
LSIVMKRIENDVCTSPNLSSDPLQKPVKITH